MFFTLFLQRKRFILSENALLTILMATRFRLLGLRKSEPLTAEPLAPVRGGGVQLTAHCEHPMSTSDYGSRVTLDSSAMCAPFIRLSTMSVLARQRSSSR
jgi:hypothetical protein